MISKYNLSRSVKCRLYFLLLKKIDTGDTQVIGVI